MLTADEKSRVIIFQYKKIYQYVSKNKKKIATNYAYTLLDK